MQHISDIIRGKWLNDGRAIVSAMWSSTHSGLTRMGAQAEQGPILVVARPSTGRVLIGKLEQAGYETHRTPGGTSLPELIRRLHPVLAIVEMGPSWFETGTMIECLLAAPRRIPILVIGEEPDVAPNGQIVCLPAGSVPNAILCAVRELHSQE